MLRIQLRKKNYKNIEQRPESDVLTRVSGHIRPFEEKKTQNIFSIEYVGSIRRY